MGRGMGAAPCNPLPPLFGVQPGWALGNPCHCLSHRLLSAGGGGGPLRAPTPMMGVAFACGPPWLCRSTSKAAG